MAERALAADARPPTNLAEVRPAAARWNEEQTRVIKQLVCVGATDAELSLFAEVCRKTGLDPFSRQIYGIKRRSRDGDKLTIQTSIDGFRLIAERTGRYGGQLGPYWCGADGQWTDVWLAEGPPAAARVGVVRTDWREPLWAVALLREYRQQSPMWDRMGVHMLAKVAESLALRRAFPAELSGLYTSEEMAQADEPAQAARPRPRPEPEPEPERRPPQPRPQAQAHAGPADAPEPAGDPDAPGSILPVQMRRLMAVTRELPVHGDPEREVRNATQEHALRAAMGRLRGGAGVASRKDLSRSEAGQLIDVLDALLKDLRDAGTGLSVPDEVAAASAPRAIDAETGEIVPPRPGLPLADAEPVGPDGGPGSDRWTG